MSRQKRVLVVDDSKSARLVLRRMLEKHGLIVDTAESATEALEYLIVNRPDAIFMDHMMPGMDGFEAVRAIKGNPQTATIPVMMYTSKGGDLYLGQARALGAVGVLPKTVAPAELYESLKRIGLVDERRNIEDADEADGEYASERLDDLRSRDFLDIPVVTATAGDKQTDEDAPVPIQLRRMLDEQRVEIRKDLLLGLDTIARQSREKIDRLLDEKIDALRQALPVPVQPSIFPTVLLAILLFLSLAWNFSSRQSTPGTQQHKTMELAAASTTQNPAVTPADTKRTSTPGKPADNTGPANALWHSVGWALNQDMNYSWDEIALDGARMQTIAQLLYQLANSGFAGKLILETHVGEFCLQGSQEKGFEPAPDDMPLDKCSAIMNPVQPTNSPSTHQSLAFANLISSSPWLQDGAIEVEIVAAPRNEPLVPYPPREPTTTAAEWNRAAAANNRVLVRLVPE
ncbi:response regulator receiver domain-containing protein [Thiogranum longum]|uniref:Response regulator receiver domain-containing protein n=1 Tax=Thiogranum longum TaxID=1537524 RepID=A0A4R1HF85_9GAMM|nr:response regulator [Thiogranum longum]TCK19431.1 response regulator receiver domain-containing protein [Thiogranum longum]